MRSVVSALFNRAALTGGGTFFKVRGTSARQKIYNIFVILIDNCDVASIEI